MSIDVPKTMVFLDIDGTLTIREQPPSPKTIEAIELLSQNGHLLFLCTGRPLCTVPKEIRLMRFDGTITLAGAHIEIGNRVIYNKAIPRLLIRETVKLILENHIACFLESNHSHCFLGMGNDYDMDGVVVKSIEEFDALDINEGFSKIVFREDELKRFKSISTFFRENYKTSNIGVGFYEMSLPGVNKATAIRKVLAYTGHQRVHTLAIGDSENDLEMLAEVEIGVVMGNAFDDVKQHADYVARSIYDDGVYYALKHFKLI